MANGVCTEPKTSRGSQAKSERLRAIRMKKSLRVWRNEGTTRAVAAALAIDPRTVRGWLTRYPDYRQAVEAELDSYASEVGTLTHRALQDHVEAAIRGDMVLVERGIDGKSGKPYERYERASLNPQIAKLALTRYDKRFTHPPQETTVRVETDVWAMLQKMDEARVDTLPALEHSSSAGAEGGDTPGDPGAGAPCIPPRISYEVPERAEEDSE